MAGNFYGLKPEVGRYDAGYGFTLLSDKQHNFFYDATICKWFIY